MRVDREDYTKIDSIKENFLGACGMSLKNKEDEYLVLVDSNISISVFEMENRKELSILELKKPVREQRGEEDPLFGEEMDVDNLHQKNEIVDFFLLPKYNRILISTSDFSLQLYSIDLKNEKVALLENLDQSSYICYDTRYCPKSRLIGAIVTRNESAMLRFFRLRGKKIKFYTTIDVTKYYTNTSDLKCEVGFSETSYIERNHLFYTFSKFESNPPFYTYVIDYRSMKIIGKKEIRNVEGLNHDHTTNFEVIGNDLVCFGFNLVKVVINYLKWD